VFEGKGHSVVQLAELLYFSPHSNSRWLRVNNCENNHRTAST